MRLWSTGAAHGVNETTVGRITTVPIADRTIRSEFVAFGDARSLNSFGADWQGYAAVICVDGPDSLRPPPPRAVYSPAGLEYLSDLDVVAIAGSGAVRVWYRHTSANNTILMTERCNSLCLMCSQPPKYRDDSDRVPLILRLLHLISPGAGLLTLSGGEPTLLGDGFFEILQAAREKLPNTGLHVLTNGRRFEDARMAARLAAIGNHDLVLGIPVYSDIAEKHDYVVQAIGAFDETVTGLYNLARVDVRLELRVVIHQQTFERLPDLAQFIARNFPFVEHVALMGLEMFGFTPVNLPVLWIDPIEYQSQLTEAVRILALSGMNVSIYNHQLCTIPRDLWPFARKSISDWKNVYLSQCEGCGVRRHCGGFFQSGTKRHSRAIGALARLSPAAEQAMRELDGEFDGQPPQVEVR